MEKNTISRETRIEMNSLLFDSAKNIMKIAEIEEKSIEEVIRILQSLTNIFYNQKKEKNEKCNS